MTVRVIGWSEERKPVDVIPMRVREKKMNGPDVLLKKDLTKIANTCARVKNETMVSHFYLDATGVAAILHMMWRWTGDAPSHAPKSNAKHFSSSFLSY
jgi:hypothetical protein